MTDILISHLMRDLLYRKRRLFEHLPRIFHSNLCHVLPE